MLGETVLQIIIASSPGRVITGDSSDPFFNLSTASAAAGFLLAVCMMLSFRSLVRGQIESYEKTNKGLAHQTSEAEDLAKVLKATQGGEAKRPSAGVEVLGTTTEHIHQEFNTCSTQTARC